MKVEAGMLVPVAAAPAPFSLAAPRLPQPPPAARAGWPPMKTSAPLAGPGRRLRPDDAALALGLFKSNRDAGLLLFAALALGALHR